MWGRLAGIAFLTYLQSGIPCVTYLVTKFKLFGVVFISTYVTINTLGRAILLLLLVDRVLRPRYVDVECRLAFKISDLKLRTVLQFF